MRKLSSKSAFFNKTVFPLLWFGFLAFFLVTSFFNGAFRSNPMFAIVPLIMAVAGFFMMKRLVWDLVDEVYDGGEFLLVRNRGEEERIALTDVMNVSASTFTNPPRISLRLRRDSKFGREITFSPRARFSLNPFASSEIADELILRVDSARTKHQV